VAAELDDVLNVDMDVVDLFLSEPGAVDYVDLFMLLGDFEEAAATQEAMVTQEAVAIQEAMVTQEAAATQEAMVTQEAVAAATQPYETPVVQRRRSSRNTIREPQVGTLCLPVVTPVPMHPTRFRSAPLQSRSFLPKALFNRPHFDNLLV